VSHCRAAAKIQRLGGRFLRNSDHAGRRRQGGWEGPEARAKRAPGSSQSHFKSLFLAEDFSRDFSVLFFFENNFLALELPARIGSGSTIA